MHLSLPESTPELHLLSATGPLTTGESVCTGETDTVYGAVFISDFIECSDVHRLYEVLELSDLLLQDVSAHLRQVTSHK